MNQSFTKLLELQKEMFLEGNMLPNRSYETKRYCVQWVWTMSKYMHVIMIAYYIWKGMKT